MNQFLVPALGVVVAAIVGGFVIVGHLRSWARREIRYALSTPSAVRIAAGRFPGRQQVYLIRIMLENSGREAITPRMFARSPIVVNLHVPVLDVVAVESAPAEMRPPDLPAADGTTVLVGPLALGRGQVVTVSVLTAGRPFHPDVAAQMPDVRLRRR